MISPQNYAAVASSTQSTSTSPLASAKRPETAKPIGYVETQIERLGVILTQLLAP